MILLLVIYYLASNGTQALPIRDLDKSTQSCRDPGQCRTIWDIIWSCIVIIFSCAWLAIHPNVPGQEERKGWRFLRRVGMFISAVIVPELMIYWATRQWWAARELKRKYKNFNWTLTHGFFAIMGGFMLYKDNAPQYTLDPWDLKPYLTSGQINVTEDEIRDRSKGDILTKGFMILQTTWFIIQLIARGVEHLPITELEIATLAFASLNFVTYGVWWNKPLNVEFPIRVYSHTDHYEYSIEDVTKENSDKGEIGNINVDSEPLDMVGNDTSSGEDSEVSDGGVRSESTHQKTSRSFKFNMLFDVLKNTRDAFQPPADSLISELRDRFDYNLWLLAFPFMLMAAPGLESGSMLKPRAKRVPTFYSGRINDVVVRLRREIIFTAVTLVTVLFGGIHCIAWRFHFPTHSEQVIWRVLSIYVTTAPMATLMIGLVANSIAARLFPWLSCMRESLFIGIPIFIALILYSLARLVLIVQTLITLRSLSPDVYTTVQWTNFIPHI